MNDLNFYKALRDAVVEHLEAEGLSFHEFMEEIGYGDDTEVVLTVNGQEVKLGDKKHRTISREYEIARLDDPIQFAYLKVNKEDKYIIFQQGYYDSWQGGDWYPDINVGTLEEYVIEYPAEVSE